MFTMTVSLDSLSLYIAAADIVILLSYVMYLIHQKRQLQAAIKRIIDFVTEYFLNTGAEVDVRCYKVENSNRYVVLIESEPLKRFRYSNVLETNIIARIFKVTGCAVEKIYWRFPVRLNNNPEVEEDKKAEDDSYFEEANNKSVVQTEYNVSEVTWDEFEHTKEQK